MTVNRPLTLLLSIDDSAVMGHRSDIDEFFKLARKRFKVKTEGKLNDFLECDMLREEGKDECWILQPCSMRNLEKLWGIDEEEKDNKCTCDTEIDSDSDKKQGREAGERSTQGI